MLDLIEAYEKNPNCNRINLDLRYYLVYAAMSRILLPLSFRWIDLKI